MGKRVYFIYTGVVESTPDKATIRDGSDKVQESQCLAFSDDPNLIHWTKVPNPSCLCLPKAWRLPASAIHPRVETR